MLLFLRFLSAAVAERDVLLIGLKDLLTVFKDDGIVIVPQAVLEITAFGFGSDSGNIESASSPSSSTACGKDNDDGDNGSAHASSSKSF